MREGVRRELLRVVFYVLYLPAGGCPWGAQTEWCGRRLALHPSRRLIPALSKGRRWEEIGGDGRRDETLPLITVMRELQPARADLLEILVPVCLTAAISRFPLPLEQSVVEDRVFAQGVYYNYASHFLLGPFVLPSVPPLARVSTAPSSLQLTV